MVSEFQAAEGIGTLNAARQLLAAIAAKRASDFTGIGVVFYVDLRSLPHLQLTNDLIAPEASRFDCVDLASLLASISTQSCLLHDGFHFVNAQDWKLTHLSQFISPPIPRDASEKFQGTGARLMAAVLASVLPGIASVGLVSHTGDVHLFCGGVDVYGES